MIHAYDKIYLSHARTSLARMLDFAVYDLHYDLSTFYEMFLKSSVSEKFQRGDYTVVVGRSGVELAYMVIEDVEKRSCYIKPEFTTERRQEYWLGWALAYYQWETGLSFEEITKQVPIEDIRALYSPYHEMDIRQFVDKMNELYRAAMPETNLKRRRLEAGFSQSQLAEMTGIPVRTIQQYEQRQKDINKAQVQYLIVLAQALCCRVEELVERV